MWDQNVSTNSVWPVEANKIRALRENFLYSKGIE